MKRILSLLLVISIRASAQINPANITIARDSFGVPHIFAKTTRDLFFAQGFVHAQDRLWQMELRRRISSGLLAEVFGARLVLLVQRWMLGPNTLGRIVHVEGQSVNLAQCLGARRESARPAELARARREIGARL